LQNPSLFPTLFQKEYFKLHSGSSFTFISSMISLSLLILNITCVLITSEYMSPVKIPWTWTLLWYSNINSHLIPKRHQL
jgi:hypothetical protein